MTRHLEDRDFVRCADRRDGGRQECRSIRSRAECGGPGVWRTLEVVVPGAAGRTFKPDATLAIFHGRHYSRVEVHAEQPRPVLSNPADASADQLRAVWGPSSPKRAPSK